MADDQEAICLRQEACGGMAEQAMARLAILQGKKAAALIFGSAGFVPPLPTGPAPPPPFYWARPRRLRQGFRARQGPRERHTTRPLGPPFSTQRRRFGSSLLWCQDSPIQAQ
jgi:hypothetical protein